MKISGVKSLLPAPMDPPQPNQVKYIIMCSKKFCNASSCKTAKKTPPIVCPQSRSLLTTCVLLGSQHVRTVMSVFHQNTLYLKRDLIYSTCYKHSVTQMPCLNCHSKPTKKPNVFLYRNYQKHFHCLNNSVVENLLWAWVGVGSVPSHVILKTLKWYQLTPLTWTLWPCLGQVFF